MAVTNVVGSAKWIVITATGNAGVPSWTNPSFVIPCHGRLLGRGQASASNSFLKDTVSYHILSQTRSIPFANINGKSESGFTGHATCCFVALCAASETAATCRRPHKQTNGCSHHCRSDFGIKGNRRDNCDPSKESHKRATNIIPHSLVANRYSRYTHACRPRQVATKNGALRPSLCHCLLLDPSHVFHTWPIWYD